MSNFPRNTNQEFIENVFTCYKMFLRRFSTNFKFPWHTVLGWKTIKCKCFERECSYFLGSWLSLKFNSNHCSSSFYSMLKCITRRILNLMPSCVKSKFKTKMFLHTNSKYSCDTWCSCKFQRELLVFSLHLF